MLSDTAGTRAHTHTHTHTHIHTHMYTHRHTDTHMSMLFVTQEVARVELSRAVLQWSPCRLHTSSSNFHAVHPSRPR